MDPLSITAIITSIGALLILIARSIKKSSCLCCNFQTRTPPETPVEIPTINIIREYNV